jgi:quinol monooxygenase YgiN
MSLLRAILGRVSRAGRNSYGLSLDRTRQRKAIRRLLVEHWEDRKVWAAHTH